MRKLPRRTARFRLDTRTPSTFNPPRARWWAAQGLSNDLHALFCSRRRRHAPCWMQWRLSRRLVLHRARKSRIRRFGKTSRVPARLARSAARPARRAFSSRSRGAMREPRQREEDPRHHQRPLGGNATTTSSACISRPAPRCTASNRQLTSRLSCDVLSEVGRRSASRFRMAGASGASGSSSRTRARSVRASSAIPSEKATPARSRSMRGESGTSATIRIDRENARRGRPAARPDRLEVRAGWRTSVAREVPGRRGRVEHRRPRRARDGADPRARLARRCVRRRRDRR